MEVKKQLKVLTASKGLQVQDVAEAVGMERQAFYNKINRNTMKFAFVEQVADALDCDVVFRDRKTGKIYD